MSFDIFSFLLILALCILIAIGVNNAIGEDHFTVIAYIEELNKWVEIPIHFGTQEFVNQHCPSEGAQGCYHRSTREIYIVTEKAGHYPDSGGCNVIWHELLHAMGYYHDWMFKNLPNKDCSYHYIHRNDWIKEKYG